MDSLLLREKVYKHLAEGIIRGEYHANDILNEHALAESFGCSRAPVRDALGMLSAEGIIKTLPRLGYEVIAISESDISNALDTRRMLECGLLEKTAAVISPKKLAVLNELAAKGRTDDSLWDHWKTNEAFHLKLASYAGNNYAYRLLQNTLSYLKFAYGQHYWDKWGSEYTPGTTNYHDQLLKALAEGDLERAKENLLGDIEHFY